MKTMTGWTSSGAVVAVTVEGLHLTEEQIDAELLGDLDTQGAGHLADCALCGGRVAQAAAPMASFREAAMAWSERRSATMPMPAVEAQGAVWQRRMGWVMATFVLGVGLALVNHGRWAMKTSPEQQAQAETPQEALPVSRVQTAALEATPVAAAAAVAENGRAAEQDRFSADNSMLEAVDVELTAVAESPAVLGLETTGDEDSDRGQPAPVTLRN